MKHLKRIGKAILAGICGFVILNILFTFYFYNPLHLANPNGNTDFIAKPNSFWVGMNEGLSWGQYDAQGYNNPEVIEDPNILVMGSSHMEGTYVRQHQLLSVQLGELLGPEARVYNIGTSGNNLMRSLQYLPKTLQVYDTPPKLIIIEAFGVSLSPEEISQVIEGSVPSIFKPKSPLLQPILGLPFMRQMAHQKNADLFQLLNPPRVPYSDTWVPAPPEPVLPADSPEGSVYDPLFAYLREVLAPYDTQLLIFLHPSEEIQEDGTVVFYQDPMRDVFGKKCEENGIAFLDLTGKFETMYKEDHKLPHGFINGAAGSGHMNADGHRAAAEAIADWIRQQEVK